MLLQSESQSCEALYFRLIQVSRAVTAGDGACGTARRGSSTGDHGSADEEPAADSLRRAASNGLSHAIIEPHVESGELGMPLVQHSVAG